jgi:CYTH domain-containing protein
MNSRYARIERERRFLVTGPPSATDSVRVRHINDLYLEGTRLRLREQTESGLPTVFKLGQKISARGESGRQGFITNIYLGEHEFRVLAHLPGRSLTKTRYSLPPFGIDVFEGALAGLVLAEAEFDSAEAADALRVPSFVVAEVTSDDRFTGGNLVRASCAELQDWLSEYGVTLTAPPRKSDF